MELLNNPVNLIKWLIYSMFRVLLLTQITFIVNMVRYPCSSTE
jgi:hypothetical protein